MELGDVSDALALAVCGVRCGARPYVIGHPGPCEPVWAAFRYRPRIGDVVDFPETGRLGLATFCRWVVGRTGAQWGRRLI